MASVPLKADTPRFKSGFALKRVPRQIEALGTKAGYESVGLLHYCSIMLLLKS